MGTALRRAWLLYAQGRYDLAGEELANELASDPRCAQAVALWALCELERGNIVSARKKAEQAVALNPIHAFSHYALAYVFYREEFFVSAEESLIEALRLGGPNPDYFALLSASLYRQGAFMGAKDAARKALEINPAHHGAHSALTLSLRDSGETNAAGEQAALGLQIAPLSVAAHLTQGELLRKAGRLKKARGHFMEAMRLDPSSPDAREGLMHALRSSIFGDGVGPFLSRLVSRPGKPGTANVFGIVICQLIIFGPVVAVAAALIQGCRAEGPFVVGAITGLPLLSLLGSRLLLDWIIQLNPRYRGLMSSKHRRNCWIFSVIMIMSYTALAVSLVCRSWTVVDFALAGIGVRIYVMVSCFFGLRS